jgi:CPA1 family monovalent cation:H+ antiporter
MTAGISGWAVLLLIAAVVGVITRRLHFPYSVGLTLTGIGLAFIPWSPSVTLSREIVYTGLLPPLIFEAAFEMRWDALRPSLALVTSLATVGVMLSALGTALAVAILLDWPIAGALAFGTLMAATDPVFVIATLREAGIGGRLAVLFEAESLLNDGTAAVLFGLVLAFAAGAPLTVPAIALKLVTTVVGAVIAGGAVAAGALALLGRTDDHLLEMTLTAVAAYGSFLLAERFGGSGVLATLTCGLLLGRLGSRWSLLSPAGAQALRTTWEFLTFIANSLVFLLVGLAVGHEHLPDVWSLAAIGIVAVLFGRAAAVYPICAMFGRGEQRVPALQQHALVWGGFRGALALALALTIPAAFPARGPVVVTTFAVVAFSVIVQGLTCRPLLRRVSAQP